MCPKMHSFDILQAYIIKAIKNFLNSTFIVFVCFCVITNQLCTVNISMGNHLFHIASGIYN